MKTVLTSLAASAVLAASAHAGGLPQDGLHAGVQVQQDRSIGPAVAADSLRAPLLAGDSLDGGEPADIVPALAAGFKGFHGVDLSAANLVPGNGHGTLPGIAGDSPYPGAPVYMPDHPRRGGLAALPADRAASGGGGLPEPGTLAILSVGLAGLVVSSRKKA